MFIVGIDIAKRSHEAIIIAEDGQVVRKAFSFRNNCTGYNLLLEQVRRLTLVKSQIVFAMESTAHYWLALYARLLKDGYAVMVLNPIQSHSLRELYIRKAKTDARDSLIIADLVRFGRCKASNVPQDKILALRELCRSRAYLVDMAADLKRKLIALLDRIFPEYEFLFESVFSKASIAVLSKYSTPQKVKNANLRKLTDMPLTADLYERNEYGDLDDSSTLLEGSELRDYQDQITAALVKNRMPEETERGIMHWYDKADSVNRKIHSAVFAVEVRDRQLWGVAECRVAGELLDAEMDTLKEFITGQASDGWCEGFEQREIAVDDGGELYVHFWNSDEWSIQTEQELFAPKLADDLPEMCFSTLPGTGELICIKRGESGYYPSDWNTDDPAHNREIADYNNERLGVTPAQEKAMKTGSMFGWGVPGADPACYEQKQEMGGMTLG